MTPFKPRRNEPAGEDAGSGRDASAKSSWRRALSGERESGRQAGSDAAFDYGYQAGFDAGFVAAQFELKASSDALARLAQAVADYQRGILDLTELTGMAREAARACEAVKPLPGKPPGTAARFSDRPDHDTDAEESRGVPCAGAIALLRRAASRLR